MEMALSYWYVSQNSSPDPNNLTIPRGGIDLLLGNGRLLVLSS